MNSLFDIPLAGPMPEIMLRGLLFAAFAVHMVFVLLAVGTAILGVYYFLQAYFYRDKALLAKESRILKSFLAHKSLAVVLGVSALLLIQVGYTVPFFTAIHIFAPYWLMIVGLLLAAFLLLDFVGQGSLVACRGLGLIGAVVGLACLLVVPGIFVAALAAMESGEWLGIMANGYRLAGTLALHWLLRYLHVLVAGVVFAAAFHYLFTAREDGERKLFSRWLTGGLLAQTVIGSALYATVATNPGPVFHAAVIAGGTAAALALWKLFTSADVGRLALPFLFAILILMLVARQAAQDAGVLPLTQAMKAHSATYEKALAPSREAALAGYKKDMAAVAADGASIYGRSCAFCHGENGDGEGAEAGNLKVKPEVLRAVRSEREYLTRKLTGGVNGSAMPYFSVYTRDRVDSIVDYLDARYQVLGAPQPVMPAVGPEARAAAEGTYAGTCARCHGEDGRGGTALSKDFLPAPPDFTRRSLNADRALQVIEAGYPGTAMGAYGQLPPEVRMGLAAKIQGFYGGTADGK